MANQLCGAYVARRILIDGHRDHHIGHHAGVHLSLLLGGVDVHILGAAIFNIGLVTVNCGLGLHIGRDIRIGRRTDRAARLVILAAR